MEELIKFNEITKKFGKTVALNKVSFSINRAETIGLIGNNGAGKTTTINLICNIYKYDSGEICIYDKLLTPNYVEYKNKMGFILSEPVYIKEFTVKRYWEFVCKFQKVEKDFCKERIKEMARFLDIENQLNTEIQKLSSGNQMKVSIGASLIHNPEILVYDEPFINLDINTTQQLLELLKEIKKTKTIFISSHSLDLVAELCDTFLIMGKEQILLKIVKQDFESIEELKNFIKSKTVEKNIKANLEWLQ